MHRFVEPIQLARFKGAFLPGCFADVSFGGRIWKVQSLSALNRRLMLLVRSNCEYWFGRFVFERPTARPDELADPLPPRGTIWRSCAVLPVPCRIHWLAASLG